MKLPSRKEIEETIRNIDFYPGVLAALFYGLTSGLMSFMNKIILTSYDYRYPEVIMLFEVILCATILEICRQKKWIDIPPFTLQRAKDFLFPSICFALQTTFALKALSDLSIPMYNILRRLIPLSTLILGAIFLDKKPTVLLTFSVTLVVAGCVVAGLGDLAFHDHIGGYISAIISVLGQSFYLVYVQKTGTEEGLSTLSILHINNINSVAILTIYTIANNKMMKAMYHLKSANGNLIPMFALDVVLGCVLNYSLFLCATMNSALTTSVVGVAKGVITTVIGFFTFGGAPLNILTISGTVLNTVGGFLYAYAKYTATVATELQKKFIVDRDIEITSKPSENRNYKEII